MKINQTLSSTALLTLGAFWAVSAFAQIDIRVPGTSVRVGASGTEINTTASKAAPVKTGASKACKQGSQIVTLSGVGDQTLNRVVCDKVVLRLNGVGDMTVKELIAKQLSIETTGTGTVSINQGKTEHLQVTHQGTADVAMQNVSADIATVKLQGTGAIQLGMIKNTLEAILSGVGDISYKGSPQVKQSVTGTGAIALAN